MAALSSEQLARWYEHEAVQAERQAAFTALPSARERWLRTAAAYRVDAESCRLGAADLMAYGSC